MRSLFITVAAVVFLFGCSGKQPPTVFEAPEADQSMKQQYIQFIKAWPCSCEELTIPTSYGSVSVLKFGKKDGKPLILMHATLVSSAMWLPNASVLAEDNMVYAVDYIGDIGMSMLDDLRKFPSDGKQRAAWLLEVMKGLGVEKAEFVSASYGTMPTLDFAIHHPDMAEKVVIIGPVCISGFAWEAITRLLPVMMANPRDPQKVREFVNWSLGPSQKVRDLCAGFLTLGLTYGNKTASVKQFSIEDLKKIRCPVLMILGNKDALFGNGRDQISRTKNLINFKSKILEGGHMISIEQSDEVNRMLIDFL